MKANHGVSALPLKNGRMTGKCGRLSAFCELPAGGVTTLMALKELGEQIHMLKKTIQRVAWAAMLAAGGMQAATFNYAVGDVLICFRRANPSTYVDLGGTNLVVDAGPISYFTNLAPNTKVTISTYTGSQLSQVGTNSVGWSAFAYFDHTAVSPAVPETIFITSPRDVLTTQTSPNHCATASANTLTIGQLGAIVAGAVDNPNTGSAALELSAYYYNSGDFSYSQGVGSSEDFNGTFTYNFEKYTPANFVTAGDPVRADFYWMYPVKLHAIASANYLGYFELGTNGVMTYMAYPTATVAVPVITSIRRTNGISYVSFTTGSSGTYTLRGTNSSGWNTARTNWPAITSVTGNGLVNTLPDTTPAANKFYVITAQ
jgi:hypothetical protein